MTDAPQIPLISVEEYLAGELDAEVRHEYVGGYVHSMAGAKAIHNQVAMSFALSIGGRLRGMPCQPFGSDMKVRIERPSHRRFYYPDGMIVCDAIDPEATYQDRPAVVAEVVSESTRRIDEGEKRDAYLTLPSLRVLLLIETDSPCVSVYRRVAEGDGLPAFTTELHRGLDAVVRLDEVGAEIPLAELYERVTFPAG